MPVSIRVNKDKLKGFPPLPPGEYEFRLDGFSPKYSKDKQSVNLNPKLVVINHPTMNDRFIPEFLNSGAGWVHIELVHALGEDMIYDGDDAGLPGEFREDPGDASNPEKWTYVGPLLGKVGKCTVVDVPSYKDASKNVSAVKKYYCRCPGCTHEHRESLV